MTNNLPSSTEISLDGIENLINSFTEEQKALHRLKMAQRPEPRPREPNFGHVAPMFHVIGEAVDVDPHEVHFMLAAAFAEPDETVVKALKHIMMVGRLRSGQQIAEHRARKEEETRKYENAMVAWEQHELRRAESLEQFNQMNARYGMDVKERWGRIVDHIEVMFDHYRWHLPSMDPHTNLFASILVRNSKHYNFNMETQTIVGDLKHAREFHRDHIAQMLRRLVEGYTRIAEQKVDNSQPEVTLEETSEA